MAPTDRLVIRASGTSSWPACNRRWAANPLWAEIKAAGYVVRDDPRGIGAVVGTSVHRAAKMMIDEKVDTGSLPPVSAAMDIAVEAAKEGIAFGVQYDQRITPNASDAHLQVARQARSYWAEVAPAINAIAIERRFEAEIPWSTQRIVLSGQPDIVAREPGKIDDLKAGSRLGYHLPQIGSYSLIVRSNNIIDIEQGNISWVPRVTMKKAQPPAVNHEIDIAKAESIATNILKSIDISVSTWRNGDEQRGIRPGDPAAFLSNPGGWLCSPKFCRAHSCGPNGWCTDFETDDGNM